MGQSACQATGAPHICISCIFCLRLSIDEFFAPKTQRGENCMFRKHSFRDQIILSEEEGTHSRTLDLIKQKEMVPCGANCKERTGHSAYPHPPQPVWARQQWVFWLLSLAPVNIKHQPRNAKAAIILHLCHFHRNCFQQACGKLEPFIPGNKSRKVRHLLLGLTGTGTLKSFNWGRLAMIISGGRLIIPSQSYIHIVP